MFPVMPAHPTSVLRIAATLGVIGLPRLLPAQQPAAGRDTIGTTVSGEVYDSVTAQPVGGAVVQMVSQTNPAVSFTVVSDSVGRYRIARVPAGTYVLGFIDETLSELGFSSVERPLEVGAAPVDDVALATPGAATIRARICGPSSPNDSTGVMVGFVRDAATGMPLGLSTVVVVWREVVIDKAGIHSGRRQIPAKTAPTGWFAICGLPTDAPLETRAELGARATGFIEVNVPLHGVLVRDFDLGADTATTAGSQVAATPLGEPIRRGTAHLMGTVRDSLGRLLEGAHVTLWGSNTTITNADGRFDLSALPSGTSTFESQYIGYEPVRRVVDLAPGRTDTLHIVMDKRVQVLAGVRVYADTSTPMKLRGFEERRKHGPGYYYTAADIAKANPLVLTDFFFRVPGIRVQPVSGLDYQLLSTQGAGFGGPCAPSIWIDGVSSDMTLGVNEMVQPDEVAGIEVYDAATAPPAYQRGACGVVLIWTK